MSTFHFQQFSVRQEQSAMKVCTDATLFGAMAPITPGAQVLDIGTGTGLLALMAAQLGAARVTAVELNETAFAEARYNFANSPWHDRLDAVHGAIQDHAQSDPNRYDLIICNPPFFQDHSRTADALRRQARHADLLPFNELIACLAKLLTEDGLGYLLLPAQAKQSFITMALAEGLHLTAETAFRGYAHNRSKVSALTFSREQRPTLSHSLTIYTAHRVYSADSEHYLLPFLLRFAEINR